MFLLFLCYINKTILNYKGYLRNVFNYGVLPEKWLLAQCCGGIFFNHSKVSLSKWLSSVIQFSNSGTVVAAAHFQRWSLYSVVFQNFLIFSWMCLRQNLCSACGNTWLTAGKIPYDKRIISKNIYKQKTKQNLKVKL